MCVVALLNGESSKPHSWGLWTKTFGNCEDFLHSPQKFYQIDFFSRKIVEYDPLDIHKCFRTIKNLSKCFWGVFRKVFQIITSLVIFDFHQIIAVLTRKWHSESADPAKALDISLAKQTDNQKIFSTHRFELSTIAFLAQCSYRLSNWAVIIWLLLSNYYYPGSDSNPDPKIRPVVHEKQLSGSQIRISIRITPNFELVLPMIITSLLTKFHQNPTSSFWEILLTNKQTNRQTHEGDCNIPLFAG